MYRVTVNLGLKQGDTAQFVARVNFRTLDGACAEVAEIEAAQPKTVAARLGLRIEEGSGDCWDVLPASEWRHRVCAEA